MDCNKQNPVRSPLFTAYWDTRNNRVLPYTSSSLCVAEVWTSGLTTANYLQHRPLQVFYTAALQLCSQRASTSAQTDGNCKRNCTGQVLLAGE